MRLEYTGSALGMRIKTLDFIKVFFSRFKSNEDGATAMEYGLVVALIAIALMLGLSQVYTSMDDLFKRVDDVVTTVDAEASTAQ